MTKRTHTGMHAWCVMRQDRRRASCAAFAPVHASRICALHSCYYRAWLLAACACDGGEMSEPGAASPARSSSRRERSRRVTADGSSQPPRRARSRSAETRAALNAAIAAAQKARAASAGRGARCGHAWVGATPRPEAPPSDVARVPRRRSWTPRWRSACCPRSPAARRGGSLWYGAAFATPASAVCACVVGPLRACRADARARAAGRVAG